MVLSGLCLKAPTASIADNKNWSRILTKATSRLSEINKNLSEQEGEGKESTKKQAVYVAEVACSIFACANAAQIKDFILDRKSVDAFINELGCLMQFPYPVVLRLVPKCLILLQAKDHTKQALSVMAKHKNSALLSENIAKTFLKPDKITETPAIAFLRETFDSGTETFFAFSDRRLLFQIIVQKLEDLVNFPEDPVVKQLVTCYRSLLGWSMYKTEKPYNSQGIAVLEELQSEIGDNESSLGIIVTEVLKTLQSYEI